VANYVPRPKLQQEIKEQLQDTKEVNEGRTLVIYGLGGSGKTQLVLNYIRECRRRYAAVFWIEAGKKESIERDYIQIYRLLFGCMASDDESVKLEDAVTAVKNWFHQRRDSILLVFDGADTINDVDDASYIDLTSFLSNGATVDTIITTRSSRAQQMTSLEAIGVAEMEAEEAVTLFCKYAKAKCEAGDTADEVLKILRELGSLPLAVTLAGSYIADTPRLLVDLRQYLPIYHKHRKQLLGYKAKKQIHQYTESILTTWETSFEAVARQSPMASRLLCLLAFLNFDDIFTDLFTATTDNATNVDKRRRSIVSQEVIFDQFDVESAFAVLGTYSLVQWRRDQDAYSMHRLVHTWSRDRLELDQQSVLSVAALKLLTDIISTGKRDVAYGLRLVPHLMTNFKALSTIHSSSSSLDEVALNLIAVVANFLNRLGRWSDQLQVESFLFQRMCEVAGVGHLDTITSMNNLAGVMREQGKYEDAEVMHQQALAAREMILGKEHPDTITSMNNLAGVMRDRGKYEDAEVMHRQALVVRERILGGEHPDTITSMNNLAGVMRDRGKYEDAEVTHRQALAVRERILGKEHPDTITSMNNLAGVMRDRGKYEDAEVMHRQALAARERILGKEHPDTVMSMSNLAGILGDQGKYKEAEKLYQLALAMMWKVLGNKHPHALTSMSNLAGVMSNQGKYEQAEELYLQALAVQENLLGEEHPETLATTNNLARVLKDQSMNKRAEDMHRKILAARKKILGKEHPDTLTTLNDLAAVISAQGRTEEAKSMLRQTIMLREKVLGKEHSSTLASTISLADVLRSQGYHIESEKLLISTIATQVRILSADSPSILRCIKSIRSVLVQSSRDQSKILDSDGQSGDYDVVLQVAAARGSEELVRLLIEKRIRINFSEVEYSKALQAASAGGHEAVVRLLLEKGADVNANLGHDGSTLQAASAGGHEAVVRLLLEKGADVNVNLGHDGSALQAASAGGHEAVVRLLLERADVNVNLGHDGSALQAASAGGHEAVVRLLLERADVNVNLGHDGSALQAASDGGHEVVVRLLIDRGALTHFMSKYGPSDEENDDAASFSSLTGSIGSLSSASAISSLSFSAPSASSATSIRNEPPEAIFTILTGEVFFDPELKDLFKKLLEIRGEPLFIRIFMREVRELCSALRTENPTDLQNGAIRILRRYNVYFAFRVCRLLKPSTAQDGRQSEELMKQIPAAEVGVENYLQDLARVVQPQQDAATVGSTPEMSARETTNSDSRNAGDYAGDHTRDQSRQTTLRGSDFVDDESNASDSSDDGMDHLPQSLTKDTISWLTKSSAFRNFKDYITRSVCSPLQHVQEVLQPTPSASKMYSATLHIDWELVRYTKSELEEGQPLSTVLVVSGGVIDAEASPCLEYCCRTWPLTGEFVVRALEKAIRYGRHGKQHVLTLAIAS